MKTIVALTTLFVLSLNFSRASGYTIVENLSYPYLDKIYHWQVESQGRTVSFKLDHSSIEYTWHDEVRAKNQFFDIKNNLIAPKPARILWAPHPTTVKTLEEVFLNALQTLGYPATKIPYLKNKDGQYRVSDIQDFLSVYRQFHMSLTPDDFLTSVRRKVNRTSNDLTFGKELNHTLIPSFANIIEPIHTNDRYDAFNLFPLTTYMKEKKSFQDELNRWLSNPNISVIELFQKSSASESVRLSLLALLTHNHLMETNLIKLVALSEGVDRAWDMAQKINDLYFHEQEFWTRGVSRHDIVRSRNENLEVLFGKTEFPPFNEFVKLQAHPTFLIDTCTKENLDIGFELSSMEIPAIRSYHFYGAIITAQRMSSLNIPLSVAEQFNAFLVAQYKNHNGIKNKEKIEYLKTIYRLGTRYVYLCR